MKKDYEKRKFIFGGIILLVALIFIIRLFYLQVVDDRYQAYAYSNTMRKKTIYPARGLIYDRNNRLMVFNESAYDLMVIPKQVKDFDTVLFSNILGLDKSDIKKRLKKAKRYSYYKESVFFSQISKELYAYFEEQSFKFSGFFIQKRSLRKYPEPVAAHILGYVGEVNSKHIKKDRYYKSGDYIGINGLENTYEKVLRGRKGQEMVLVDVLNREKSSYKDGKYDTLAVKGKDIYTTIDMQLQAYGEKLMSHKIGSIVAIEPKTGEVLSLISSPTYDPNMLVGQIRGSNYAALYKDSLKPLFNRALMAQYPPGSTFKMLNGLIALQEDAIHSYTIFSCNGTVSKPIRCSHEHKTPLGIVSAIEVSCNPFFWKSFEKLMGQEKYNDMEVAFNTWREYVVSMGFGKRFNTDLIGESSGNIPKSSFYDYYYKKGHWNAKTIRSLSIGQGEILVTPMQLANMVAVIANRGYYVPPHLIKSVENDKETAAKYQKKVFSKINPKYYNLIVEGMRKVFTGKHGTARFYDIAALKMCGKTGTVQNPHGDDHSLFIAFAPMDNPKIAIAVVVENSGFGSRWAVPIASLMIEKYLTDTITRPDVEKRMVEKHLINRINNE